MSLFEVASAFPAVNVKVNKLQRAFYNLGYPLDARRWFSFSLFLGLLVGLLAYALTENPTFGIGGFLLTFALFYYLPILEDKKRQAMIEAEMPLFLRDFGSLLNMDIPFVVALRILSRREGEMAKEVRKALREIEKGASIPKALSAIAERVESNDVKRAIAQIMVAYEQGGGGEGLRRMGDDLLNMQKFKLSEYASKSSLMGLAFIMFAVIAPTFYIIISLVAPLMFGGEADVEKNGLIVLLLFPLLSMGVITVMKGMTPTTALREKEGFNAKLFALSLLLAFAFYLDIEMTYKLILAGAIFLALIAWQLKAYLKEKALEEVDAQLPNALLAVASLPRGAKVERIFETIAKMNYGLLSEEFRKALKEIKSGLSVVKVIEDMKERLPTEGFRRVADVLLYSLQSGHSVSERMAELADDFFLFMEIRRKKAELMSMQKYTLMVGVLLMAVILSMALTLVEQMMSVAKEGIDLTPLTERYLPAYLIINAALVADFASYVEGKRSKAYIYFSVLMALSLAIFLINAGVVDV